MTKKQRASKRAWLRRRYEARVAEGACITCGGDRAPESRWKCRPCLDANAALQLRKRALRPTVRLCACGAVLEKRRHLCIACRLASKERRRPAVLARMRRYYHLRRERYIAAQRARYARFREAGVCYLCGDPSGPFACCWTCRMELSRRKRAKATAVEKRAA